jgi:hypothetical protein
VHDQAAYRSSDWVDYFQERLLVDRWHCLGAPDMLDRNEQGAVLESIRIFQLGESGEGKHFLKCAQQYAARTGDHNYLIALEYFLGEEHDHARQLGRLLDHHRVPRLTTNWTDHLFRWLRHRAGLELTISVLLTAEVIAQVYYQALQDATNSTWLRGLCRQILRDEVGHIHFQSERLAILRAACSATRRRWTIWLEYLLMFATMIVVFRTHRSVFAAAQMSWSRYWQLLWRRFRRSVALRDPNHERAPISETPTMPMIRQPQLAKSLQELQTSSRSEKWLD